MPVHSSHEISIGTSFQAEHFVSGCHHAPLGTELIRMKVSCDSWLRLRFSLNGSLCTTLLVASNGQAHSTGTANTVISTSCFRYCRATSSSWTPCSLQF